MAAKGMRGGFAEEVYAALKKVPKGKVTTYKELARAVGTHAYRAVGTAMKKNKDPIHIHCYKVIRSDGSIGAYSALGGTVRKAALLKSDGIEKKDGKIDLRRYRYRFR
jgi:methylated-DNA-[protein]-cysteine S-methyltransferase